MMFVECLQKMSRISRILLLLLVLSNMHFLHFNASGETLAGGRQREGKCKLFIETIHPFLHHQYFLINIHNSKLQPVSLNISYCMKLLKNFVNMINVKTLIVKQILTM